jgi:hypothetical protein
VKGTVRTVHPLKDIAFRHLQRVALVAERDPEQKKYRLGASTTANVLQQERVLASGENNLIAATAAYANDRSSLEQILSNTLDRYGISLTDAATGTVTQMPMIPGLTPPTPNAAPKPLPGVPGPPPSQ